MLSASKFLYTLQVTIALFFEYNSYFWEPISRQDSPFTNILKVLHRICITIKSMISQEIFTF